MFTLETLSPYLLTQRSRLGLRQEHIAAAGRSLNLPWEELRERARRLLMERHGLSGRDVFPWLRRQPVRTKADIRSLLAEIPDREKKRLEKRKTSGSTGVPFIFYRDREMSAWMEATSLALYAWHGQRPWNRQARFWGAPMTRLQGLRQAVKDGVLGRRRLSAFKVSDDRCRRFFLTLRRFRPTHAYGYPSLLSEFAARCLKMGLDGADLGFEVVFSTGEPLFPHTRSQLEEFFDCRVANEYGCSESGVLAFDCEAGGMHLTPIATWIEILDQDTGEEVRDRPGIAVLSDLMGGSGPFLRYRLGDLLTVQADRGCACGRDLPSVQMDSGRLDSFIVLPGGEKVYDAILAYAVPPSVRRFRGEQTSRSSLDVIVELYDGTDAPVAEEAYGNALRSALGPEMDVTVRQVKSIPPDPSGKLRYFIPLSG